MTDAVSPKLLAVLALAVVVAGFGGWRLLTADGESSDVGFDDTILLPAATPASSDGPVPVPESHRRGGRNPFQSADATIAPPSSTEATDDIASDAPTDIADATAGSDDATRPTATPGSEPGEPSTDDPETENPGVTDSPTTTPPAVDQPVFPDPDLVDLEDEASGGGR